MQCGIWGQKFNKMETDIAKTGLTYEAKHGKRSLKQRIYIVS